MIDKVHGEIRLICDNDCGEATDLYDRDDFKSMIKDAKDNGWVVETDENGDWTHYCPDCT